MAELIKREDYSELLRKGRDLTDTVKVVTGMRRSGKTTLLEMFVSELKEEGIPQSNIMWIDFESFESKAIKTSEQLDAVIIDGTEAVSGTVYVFLDEIQNVEGWESTVSSLISGKRYDIYITGSNSKMLSSDLSTHLSGRYVEIEVLPLSFKEYLMLYGNQDVESKLRSYMQYGGLPEINPSRGEAFCNAQLEGIVNTVLVKDVIERLGVSDGKKLMSIARFLYSNIGNITNIDAIAKAAEIGNTTAERYVCALEDAFLFHHSERYDAVGKKIFKSNGKYYASDLGMRRTVLKGECWTDISRPLENVVYLELIRRGYTVRIGSIRDKEIDFMAFKGDTISYYQVAQTMLAEDTRQRELSSLNAVKDNYPKTVLTLDRFGLGSENGIVVTNLIDWLIDG